MSVYSISGYWLDDKSEFNDYLATDFDSVPEGYGDDEMFYYGIKPIIGNVDNEFYITDIVEVENV